eukprot:CAMPEP_0118944026 /NCGR_PEP_ID=MMETSP1169-20130426/39515_1 /TAXON_ID=36882 /ORGANISM="Pyramimonas obovata, Strain CCMP722" /LENGTH=413 /DNA_ID=CAMNT_0006889423 /DNA_START=245 /DNA_END=1482 /DNA_ORIENTATION=+
MAGLSDSPVVFEPETAQDQEQLSRAFEDHFIAQDREHHRVSRISKVQEPEQSCSLAMKVFDISELLNEGAKAVVDDTFTKCFKSTPAEQWNWNIYLFPMWLIGVCIRYLVLFPVRCALLFGGFLVFLVLFFTVHFTLRDGELRRRLERSLTEFMCGVFVASWSGVVKYHGPRPTRGPNKVCVANHTSMIDFIILQQVCGHAVIMQKHKGWVGFMQSQVLSSIGCIQFDRQDIKDRSTVAQRLRAHVRDGTKNPLLIFPEGTCVNNEFCVMFKKGAFDLGATVHPIAIKYNKIFVDAFWNSRRQSFTQHLMRLMTSWAVVCDVWYLEPQEMRENETPEMFAERVQEMICRQAGITKVRWDGMLKYYRPRPALTEKRRMGIAAEVKEELHKVAPLPGYPDPDDDAGEDPPEGADS